ncbi:ROK family protein [Sciscionella sediminilitoris]|uniref:ROK family protein n=1 Tax=Sciscionella sediminilitoris TaxID=1445613 RepID=UPI0009EA9F9A|nr:ROK family protein [Sciscionella sp. SE31]
MNEPRPVPEPLVAVDIGGTKTVIACEPFGTERLPTMDAGEDGPSALRRILRITAKLLCDTGHAHIGIVCPGHVTAEGIALSPNLPGLERFDLPGAIRAELPGHTVALGHDVRAAALAELRTGALRGVDPGVYLNLGTGVFAAPILDGRILTGANGFAGEIGYARILGDPRMLEEIVGGGALVAAAGRGTGDGDLTASAILRSTDPRLAAIAGEALDRLAETLAQLVLVLDPAVIAVGGGLMSTGSALLEALRTRLAALGADRCELRAAAYTQDAALRGAFTLAEEARTGRLPGWAVRTDGQSPADRS